MKAKLALSVIVAALASACAETPTWDTSVFPEQMVYGAAAPEGSVTFAPGE